PTVHEQSTRSSSTRPAGGRASTRGLQGGRVGGPADVRQSRLVLPQNQLGKVEVFRLVHVEAFVPFTDQRHDSLPGDRAALPYAARPRDLQTRILNKDFGKGLVRRAVPRLLLRSEGKQREEARAFGAAHHPHLRGVLGTLLDGAE